MIRASGAPAERAAAKLIGVQPRELPILFSSPMIKAILAGSKTVTRRVVTPAPPDWATESGQSAFTPPGSISFRGNHPEHGPAESFRKQRWSVGDSLWVRETWRTFTREADGVAGIMFRADDAFVEIENSRDAADLWIEAHDNGKHGNDWRPSIFMRPWMSRIKLEVIGVSVERLQDITAEQACAEGTPCWVCGRAIDGLSENDCECFHSRAALGSFGVLWESINGKRAPWSSNPWVTAISFKRMQS